MKKKNKEKICKCGRIITDPKNKTGLCSDCTQKGILFIGSLAGIGVLIKKYGIKGINFAKSAISIVKKSITKI